jgi:hypothetical protein
MNRIASGISVHLPRWRVPAAALVLLGLTAASNAQATFSVARQWNEQQLDAIRIDLARPTVTARNLYHVSLAMYDAWATFDLTAHTVLFQENHATGAADTEAKQNEAISYAAYRMLIERYSYTGSPGWAVDGPKFDQQMADLGYDINVTTTVGDTPAAIGNRIAAQTIAYCLTDNANEQDGYKNKFYATLNQPLIVKLPGNLVMANPNTWQPLALDYFIDQGGNPVPGGSAAFLSAEWGKVTPFAMTTDMLNIYDKPGTGTDWWVYHDPGPFAHLDGTPEDTAMFAHTFEMVSTWESHLDPTDGVMWDISPNSLGKTAPPDKLETVADIDAFYDFLGGGDNGTGYTVNPVTGQPYPTQIVPRGDYARCLAEFWADGPTSETPPGHWFTIINYATDQPGLQKRIGGTGPVVSDLEWDIKAYITLGGAMHDSAVSVWGNKGYHDGVRPVSAIRHMASLGQSTDTLDPSYNPQGLELIPDFVEIITAADTGPGGKMESLAGFEGQIAVRSWRGPDYIANPAIDDAGVGWILGSYWWPYQRPTFVTPPFGGWTSGHSCYSRAGATVMDKFTGSPYFPNGLGTFDCPQNQYLVFEEGPSVDVQFQWVSYYDASDQCSLSRIWGGIHPGIDDIPSRVIGIETGTDAFNKATALFSPWTDLGQGFGGAGGLPVLVGVGKLDSDAPGSLTLSNAAPSTSTALLISLSSTPVSFKGGVLVAYPWNLLLWGSTKPDGTEFLGFHWPPGIAAETQVFFQYVVRDLTAPQHFAMSNAISAVTP